MRFSAATESKPRLARELRSLRDESMSAGSLNGADAVRGPEAATCVLSGGTP